MNWTFDDGDGPVDCQVPHVWHLKKPVTWEGPATYRTTLPPSKDTRWLVFEGVSYRAEVTVQDAKATATKSHTGIWDAFSVRVPPSDSQTHITVQVTKNGGPAYPVTETLAGFLPYVYNTFGGIFRPVRLTTAAEDPLASPEPAPPPRISVENNRLRLDAKPFFMRGVLTWGWDPKTAAPNPTIEDCHKELSLIAGMGFNTVKFCLWLPPHHMLELLPQYGLVAWLELPLWMPSPSPEFWRQAESELGAIVDQYKRHPAIVAWTVGCELGKETPPGFRQKMVALVQEKTRCPLVRDNSGSAEMYGGDLPEHATFQDFHPYCDTPFYRPVLESLATQASTPILLGEFNDYDHLRDLPRLKAEAPYWASPDPDLNDKGVRWQHDLPDILQHGLPEIDYPATHRFSVSKGHFIRRRVHETVRSISAYSGYVLTGWRDTPISTSGMVNDDLEPVYWPQHWSMWNQQDQFFLLPQRRPPWIDGGNRPAWADVQTAFAGAVQLQVGLHSEPGVSGEFEAGFAGTESQKFLAEVPPLQPTVLCVVTQKLAKGKHLLEVKGPSGGAAWPVTVFEPLDTIKADPAGEAVRHLPCTGGPHEVFVGSWQEFQAWAPTKPWLAFIDRGLAALPFWRECVFTYKDPGLLPFANRWEWLFCVSGDQFFNTDHECHASATPWMNRWDTRTYQRSSAIIQCVKHSMPGIATTLRPWGGLGSQPGRYADNPAGHGLVASLLLLLEKR